MEWVQYDQLHTYWKASVGGSNPDHAYRQYVKEGLHVPDDAFKKELREWVFGSKDFLRRMLALAEGETFGDRACLTIDSVEQTFLYHDCSKTDAFATVLQLRKKHFSRLF